MLIRNQHFQCKKEMYKAKVKDKSSNVKFPLKTSLYIHDLKNFFSIYFLAFSTERA